GLDKILALVGAARSGSMAFDAFGDPYTSTAISCVGVDHMPIERRSIHRRASPASTTATASGCRSGRVRRSEVVDEDRPVLSRHLSAEADHLGDRLLPLRPATRSDHRCGRVALATRILKYADRLLRARERSGSQKDPYSPHRDNISKRGLLISHAQHLPS